MNLSLWCDTWEMQYKQEHSQAEYTITEIHSTKCSAVGNKGLQLDEEGMRKIKDISSSYMTLHE